MRPQFGAGLPNYIHRPNNEATRQIMADVARSAVQRSEPRIELLDVVARPDPADASVVLFSLSYRDAGDRNRGPLRSVGDAGHRGVSDEHEDQQEA